ncbi:hypothetical protein HBI25_198600 [Parastagonospora nodorum]|nr:hypothetical protein HBI25_198600 [Parastagonospora nodorum]
MCNSMPTSLTKPTKTTTTTLHLNNIYPTRRARSSRGRYSMHAGLRKELGARHSLLNLSVHDLVEEFTRHNRSSLYYSNSNSNTATRKTRIKACARLIKRQRLESEAQLRKASEEEELAKTKKEKREKEAQKRKARLDSLLDSDDYCLDSSPDINPKDDLEDEKATTAKDLAREQKERLKALLNAKYNKRQSLRESRDSNRTLHSRRLIGAYILYFKELLSNNGRIFASVIGITRTQAIVLSAIIGHNEVVAIDPANSTLCDLSNPLVVRFCIFSNSALENIGIPTNKELAAVNKLVRLQTFTLKILDTVSSIVCGQTIFDKFHNCKSEGIIIAKFYKDLQKYN